MNWFCENPEISLCFIYFTELLFQAEDTNKLGWAAWPVFCLSYRRLLPHLEGKTGVEWYYFLFFKQSKGGVKLPMPALDHCPLTTLIVLPEVLEIINHPFLEGETGFGGRYFLFFFKYLESNT